MLRVGDRVRVREETLKWAGLTGTLVEFCNLGVLGCIIKSDQEFLHLLDYGGSLVHLYVKDCEPLEDPNPLYMELFE